MTTMNHRLAAWLMTAIVLSAALFSGCSEFEDFVSSDGGTSTQGSMARFTIKGDYLYIVDIDRLMAFDIADSTNVKLRSIQDAGWGIETIFAKDSLLFLGSTDGLFVFGLNKPSKPSFISNYRHITSFDPVVVRGKYAFVTLRSDWPSVNELQVIDITNIKNPVQVATYSMTAPRGLSITDSLLFVCDGSDLVVMKATDPLSMTVKQRFQMEGIPYDVIARNGLLTLSFSDGLAQYTYTGDTIQWLSTLY